MLYLEVKRAVGDGSGEHDRELHVHRAGGGRAGVVVPVQRDGVEADGRRGLDDGHVVVCAGAGEEDEELAGRGALRPAEVVPVGLVEVPAQQRAAGLRVRER